MVKKSDAHQLNKKLSVEKIKMNIREIDKQMSIR